MATDFKFTRKQQKRFWNKVEHTGTCWLWRGHTGKNGYGVISRQPANNRSRMYAHRAAFKMAFGVSPGVVCHTCDIRNCVRPTHLFAGSIAINNRDMVQKGRGGTQIFNPKQRKILRSLYSLGAGTYKHLGLQYNVDRTTIGHIVRRKTGAYDGF